MWLQLSIYFSCEGVRHCAMHGANPPQHVWPDEGCSMQLEGDPAVHDTPVAEHPAPPPSFVRDLGVVSSRGAIKVHVDDPRPVNERLLEVASVTSAMDELDTKLTDWLHRLKP